MKTKLKDLFLLGIPASLGSPLFLGLAAIGTNLFGEREIHLDSIGLYMLTIWGFSLVLTEVIVFCTVVIALLLHRDEINVLNWSIVYVSALLILLVMHSYFNSNDSNLAVFNIFVIISNVVIFVIISKNCKNQ